MAIKQQPQSETPQATEVQLGKQVVLSPVEWKNLLTFVEAGVKAVGYPAFKIGHDLISEVNRQLSRD